LEEAGERGLYDLVQTDSEVERKFVKRVKPDDKVVFYFKFPASFRIKLPKVIGDYNPDWGLMRRNEKGKFLLQLIRETKFTAVEHLRFPHEKRKVACARQHFRNMNIDYRPIFPDFEEWWKPEESNAM
jgi:type III restriction enzyme